MAEVRPRRALRPPLAVRIARIAIPAAVVGVVATGVIVAASPGQTQVAYPVPAANIASPYSSSSATVASRHQAGSRGLTNARPSVSSTAAATSASPAATAKPSSSAKPSPSAKPSEPVLSLEVTDKKYATADLNIRTKPKQDADVVSEVKAGTRLSITKTVRDGYRYVSFEGKGRWVTNKYLADKKPSAATLGGISNAPCASGSKMESGLTPDAIKVHRTLCARYPQVTSFGGTRGGGGNHGSGRAVDCMISNTAVGLQMAEWVRAHAKQLGVSEVIYRQRIWTVQRGSEGWRGMSDRGSATANHYDHVHVSVYGNRATG